MNKDLSQLMIVAIIVLGIALVGISMQSKTTSDATIQHASAKEVEPEEYWTEISTQRVHGFNHMTTYTNDKGQVIVVVTGDHSNSGASVTQIK